MRAALYAVKTSGESHSGLSWKWYLSLDMSVDIQYWSSHSDHRDIIYIHPQLSLGLASFLKYELSAITEPLNSSSDESVMEKWPNCIRKSINSFYKVFDPNHRNIVALKITRGSIVPDEVKVTLDLNVLNILSGSLQGRALLLEELLDLFTFLGIERFSNQWRSYTQAIYLQGDIEIGNGVKFESIKLWLKLKHNHRYRCQRCGSNQNKMYWSYCESCQLDCPYCEACLNMGQARFCSLLIYGKSGTSYTKQSQQNQQSQQSQQSQQNQLNTNMVFHTNNNDQTSIEKRLKQWNLSPAQEEAALEGLRFLTNQPLTNGVTELSAKSQPPCFLIWAVTGAGKTEMIFPLIANELSRGAAVLIATPRKDVVIELQPRLKAAFPNQTLVTLYGGSEQRWEEGDITLATTHQLLRFWKRFDLIIIDEIDAFPFHNNPMLDYAARKACAYQGRYILLSATPPAHLQKSVKLNKLPHAKVPVRYHRYPLPVPKRMRMKSLKKLLLSSSISFVLHRQLQASLDRGAQIFLFIPKISFIEPLLEKLRIVFSEIQIQGTSSQDPFRSEKIQNFRAGHIRLLITTTILERGVTIPKTDVFVLDADSNLYDEAALVQMAGRSGRASSDPLGNVYFFAEEKTKSQMKAIKQISRMNRLAQKKGWLL